MNQMPDGPATTALPSDRETMVTRTLNAPLPRVFQAWTNADLFRQWWVPRSCGLTLQACDMDVRVGGRYRLAYAHPDAPEPMAFFGTYLDVTPDTRLVWTNDEGDDAVITTVTFTDRQGITQVTVHDLYPSTDAFTAQSAPDVMAGMAESLDQLDAFLTTGQR